VKLGYSQCCTDSCLYYKRDQGDETLVAVCVDDLLVTGRSGRVLRWNGRIGYEGLGSRLQVFRNRLRV
jgi:hypothetical protein